MITLNKVVMLATNEPTKITQSITSGRLFYNNSEILAKRHMDFEGAIPQHLYILSNDVVEVMQGLKEGDKIMCDERNHISEEPKYVVRTFSHYKNGWIMTKELPGQGENPDWTNKIFTSTNETLPIISDEFISRYCEEDGINEVMIKNGVICR